MASKIFKANNNEVFEVGGRVNKTVINLSKNLTYILNIEAIKKLTFLILNAKKTFNYLQLVFIKALILQHFDLKIYIWIETKVLGYAINRVLNQLI